MARKGQDLEAAERRVKSVELRKGGASYRQIGDMLKVSHTQARNDVLEALASLGDELRTQARALLALEYERLEYPMQKLLVEVQKGNIEAIDQWRKLCESRAALIRMIGLQSADDGGEADAPDSIVIDITPESARRYAPKKLKA